MPRDMGILVEIANGIIDGMNRRVDFIHMPVPQDRTDREYFRPLQELRMPAKTELILGLIHHDDRAGDRARIDAARAFVDSFGVASECGWGRTDPARVPGLLESHRRAVEYINAG